MRVKDFIWLEAVLDKLAVKHSVSPDEVEEMFFNCPRYRKMERGHFQGEDVYRALGQTDAGRYLTVFSSTR